MYACVYHSSIPMVPEYQGRRSLYIDLPYLLLLNIDIYSLLLYYGFWHKMRCKMKGMLLSWIHRNCDSHNLTTCYWLFQCCFSLIAPMDQRAGAQMVNNILCCQTSTLWMGGINYPLPPAVHKMVHNVFWSLNNFYLYYV